jgi:L-ascorbate metabolism protein UlaG (beta-lactamase superfamily)
LIKHFKNTAFIIPVLAIMLSGCWFVRMGMRNLDDAVFSSPEKVKNKIKNPVNDNVRFSALWVGLSTVLLQIDDKVIITDPVFEDVIGGVVMRKVEAGLDIESIPKLDLILISHAHMDHLSFSSLKKLDDKFHEVKLVFPEGTEKYLPSYNMEMIKMRTGNSKERHYIGETKTVNGITVTAVYVLHQGGKFGFDSYLWKVPGCTGYIIEYHGITVYFAGDTSYDDEAFKELGKKFKIDLALIPVGPCRDCETDESHFHVASLGALKMLDDVRADYMIPIHWGSITYFNDPDTPIIALKDLIKKYSSTTATGVASNIPYSEKVKILNAGEQIIFKYK